MTATGRTRRRLAAGDVGRRHAGVDSRQPRHRHGDLTALPVQPALLLINGTPPPPDFSLDVTPTPATDGPGYTLKSTRSRRPHPTRTRCRWAARPSPSPTLGLNARTTPSLEGAVVGIAMAVLPMGRSADDDGCKGDPCRQPARGSSAQPSTCRRNIDSAPVVGEETPAAGRRLPPPPALRPPRSTRCSVSTRGRSLSNDAEPLETLALGTELTATARSADNLWLPVQLEDGTTGWILADTADLSCRHRHAARGAEMRLPQADDV